MLTRYFWVLRDLQSCEQCWLLAAGHCVIGKFCMQSCQLAGNAIYEGHSTTCTCFLFKQFSRLAKHSLYSASENVPNASETSWNKMEKQWFNVYCFSFFSTDVHKCQNPHTLHRLGRRRTVLSALVSVPGKLTCKSSPPVSTHLSGKSTRGAADRNSGRATRWSADKSSWDWSRIHLISNPWPLSRPA